MTRHNTEPTIIKARWGNPKEHLVPSVFYHADYRSIEIERRRNGYLLFDLDEAEQLAQRLLDAVAFARSHEQELHDDADAQRRDLDG